MRQETGNRRRETVDGKQETGDRRRETEDGRQETGDGRQEMGDGRQETGQETGNRRRETESGSQETGHRSRETGEGSRVAATYVLTVVSNSYGICCLLLLFNIYILYNVCSLAVAIKMVAAIQ